LELVVEARDGAAERDELPADVGERPCGDLVGAGESVAGDGPDFGEAGGDGGRGVLADLVDGVLLVGELLLERCEVGYGLRELAVDLSEYLAVSIAERHIAPL
jgi:hypothetical protein